MQARHFVSLHRRLQHAVIGRHDDPRWLAAPSRNGKLFRKHRTVAFSLYGKHKFSFCDWKSLGEIVQNALRSHISEFLIIDPNLLLSLGEPEWCARIVRRLPYIRRVRGYIDKGRHFRVVAHLRNNRTAP